MARDSRLRGYQALIAETAGTTDPAAVAFIEELMRTERPTLDALTQPECDALVVSAIPAVAELAAAGQLAMISRSGCGAPPFQTRRCRPGSACPMTTAAAGRRRSGT
jgi:hypothetical protein